MIIMVRGITTYSNWNSVKYENKKNIVKYYPGQDFGEIKLKGFFSCSSIGYICTIGQWSVIVVMWGRDSLANSHTRKFMRTLVRSQPECEIVQPNFPRPKATNQWIKNLLLIQQTGVDPTWPSSHSCLLVYISHTNPFDLSFWSILCSHFSNPVWSSAGREEDYKSVQIHHSI